MAPNPNDVAVQSSLTVNGCKSYPCKKPRIGSRTHQQLLAVYTPRYDNWLQSFGLKPCWETHKDCHESYIWHGYRPNPSTLRYCLKSAFHPTNETLNFWTHFIPLLIMIWKIDVTYGELKHPFEEITYPFWTHSLGTILVLLVSACAHLFCCYSAVAQEVCFCLDYGIIPVFGLTVAISFDHYLCSFDCFGMQTEFLPRINLIAMSLAALIGTCVACWSRYPSCPMRYLCRYGPSIFCFVTGAVPCYIRLLIGELHTTKNPDHCRIGNDFDKFFSLHAGVLVLSIIFLTSHFPERLISGWFDIVAHSHQWFHILTATGIYLQYNMAENALKEAIALRDSKLLDEDSLRISVWSTFVPVLICICILPFITVRTALKVGNIVDEERNKVE